MLYFQSVDDGLVSMLSFRDGSIVQLIPAPVRRVLEDVYIVLQRWSKTHGLSLVNAYVCVVTRKCFLSSDVRYRQCCFVYNQRWDGRVIGLVFRFLVLSLSLITRCIKDFDFRVISMGYQTLVRDDTFDVEFHRWFIRRNSSNMIMPIPIHEHQKLRPLVIYHYISVTNEVIMTTSSVMMSYLHNKSILMALVQSIALFLRYPYITQVMTDRCTNIELK